jgi:hypothetical protein
LSKVGVVPGDVDAPDGVLLTLRHVEGDVYDAGVGVGLGERDHVDEGVALVAVEIPDALHRGLDFSELEVVAGLQRHAGLLVRQSAPKPAGAAAIGVLRDLQGRLTGHHTVNRRGGEALGGHLVSTAADVPDLVPGALIDVDGDVDVAFVRREVDLGLADLHIDVALLQEDRLHDVQVVLQVLLLEGA